MDFIPRKDTMKIVVGYEGSKPCLKALKLAATYAKTFKATVLVLNSQVGGEDSPKEEIIEAQKHLAFAEELLTKNRIACETHLLVRGNMPGEDIVEFAKEQKADQIIIGIKRLSKVGKLVFGSNAAYVVLNAHCPVVTTR
jgi:nucleotide-binding universal stress UspA family protein